MNEDNDQQQKQQFLRENILEKGFDANEFMEYFKETAGVQEMVFILKKEKIINLKMLIILFLLYQMN